MISESTLFSLAHTFYTNYFFKAILMNDRGRYKCSSFSPVDDVFEAAAAADGRPAAEMTEPGAGNAGKTVLASPRLQIHKKSTEL